MNCCSSRRSLVWIAASAFSVLSPMCSAGCRPRMGLCSRPSGKGCRWGSWKRPPVHCRQWQQTFPELAKSSWMSRPAGLPRLADLNSLADAMAQLMQTPQQERRAMGERARRHVTERFSMEVVLDRWETLYEEFLQRNPIPIRWRLRELKRLA